MYFELLSFDSTRAVPMTRSVTWELLISGKVQGSAGSMFGGSCMARKGNTKSTEGSSHKTCKRQFLEVSCAIKTMLRCTCGDINELPWGIIKFTVSSNFTLSSY